MSGTASVDQQISFLGVGDVGPVHGPVDRYCELVLPTLQAHEVKSVPAATGSGEALLRRCRLGWLVMTLVEVKLAGTGDSVAIILTTLVNTVLGS